MYRGSFKVAALAVVAVLALSAVASVARAKDDLASDAKLRIGVKHRPAECTRKSKKGDSLSMHYTGTLYSVRCVPCAREAQWTAGSLEQQLRCVLHAPQSLAAPAMTWPPSF